jgi:hypothetical protein
MGRTVVMKLIYIQYKVGTRPQPFYSIDSKITMMFPGLRIDLNLEKKKSVHNPFPKTWSLVLGHRGQYLIFIIMRNVLPPLD